MTEGVSSPALQEKVRKVFGDKPLPARVKADLEFLVERAAGEAGGPEKVTLDEIVGIKELLEGMAF